MENKNVNSPFSVQEACPLLEFLLSHVKSKSRNKIKSLLGHGQILVNDKIIRQFNHMLGPGDKVYIQTAGTPTNLRFQKIKIVYEDESLIVVDKKPGILSVSTEKQDSQTVYSMVSDYVKSEHPSNKIFVLHRLDKDASGLLMFARNQPVQEKLQNNWQEMVFERIYSVLVEGQLEEPEGTIRSWLKENKNLVMFSSQVPGNGQEAVTHFRLVKKARNYSLLDVELETGRKNQIRVHMQSIGHPIAGDRKYGAHSNPIGRLALHARVLGFFHPVLEKQLRFESPLPGSFRGILV